MTQNQKKQAAAAASLVIRGSSTQYVPGLGKDGFAVVHAHTIYVVGDQIHGMFYDNQGRCGHFHMPIGAFEYLEYIELGQNAETEVEETEEDEEDEDDARPKAA
jgi:hypothetical protein